MWAEPPDNQGSSAGTSTSRYPLSPQELLALLASAELT